MDLEFKNVKKKYQGITVLDQLCFHVSSGQFAALLGRNGCGKTTTINIISNIISYNGTVKINNKHLSPSSVSYKKNLGIMLGSEYLIQHFNAVSYLTFVGKLQEIPKNEINKRISDILELLEFSQKKTKIHKLSTGNQVKVSLAAALIHNPEMLVLDEPFTNLDIPTTNTVMNILKNFKGKKTIFITSHNLDLVVDLCDEFLIMEKGKIILKVSKKDYEDVEALKLAVKNIIVKDNANIDISWLN